MRRVLWTAGLKAVLLVPFGKAFQQPRHKYLRFPVIVTRRPFFCSIRAASTVALPMTTNVSQPEDPSQRITVYTMHNVSETLSGLLDVGGISSQCGKETIDGACIVLQSFLQSTETVPKDSSISLRSSELTGDYLGNLAVQAADQLCQIPTKPSPSQKKKQAWQALQAAAEELQIGSTWESSALAISLVFGALSLLQPLYESQENSGLDAKAAASAVSSTSSRNKPLRHLGRAISAILLRSYLVHAAHTDIVNLHILNHFARAFKLGADDVFENQVTANAIQHAMRDSQNDHILLGDESDEKEANSQKRRISGALALACQLQPWSVVCPETLVEAAIPYELYHVAEDICRAAHKASMTALAPQISTKKTFSQLQQQENSKRAVELLIDSAMEGRMYRRADALATSLYDAGGRSRYVEARFNHACETISKVVYRRQIPIVDRQIERVDKAVAKVQQDESTFGPAVLESISTTDPSQDIRKYAIERLEEAGDITSVQRLASVFGMDYVYDERTILLAAAMRRRRYLQFDDVLPGPIPSLISTPDGLQEAFTTLRDERHRNGPFGLDAEWDEETKGAAVLQLANEKMAVLIDVPALLVTEEGVRAMEATVGALFNCPDSVVAGFACRQDLQRLRASPISLLPPKSNKSCEEGQPLHPWLHGTRAVIDVQTLVGKKEPKLLKVGLSRVCQNYFGKPLDKAEQCSLWSGRPLSEQQRAYAALDAWVCVAIYNKVSQSSPASLLGGPNETQY